ncbi:MAG TPA: hypothetical protein VI408_07655 [Gaiellaceae bacterium]
MIGTAARIVAVAAAAAAGLAWSLGGAPHRAAVARAEARPAPVLKVERGLEAPQLGPTLPAGTEHGLAMRLQQYPDLALATIPQRRAARLLLEAMRRSALRWRDPHAAAAAGFDVKRPRRRPGETRVMWFHSENRAWHSDRRYLDPQRPDTLIFADLPGRPLELVGVMISMPRGLRGPTPGGPITRWHSHLVCVHGRRRGLKPLASGACRAGSVLRQGSEMMHIWFTRDLRSAFAIHAPGPELCAAGYLTPALCRHPEAMHAM